MFIGLLGLLAFTAQAEGSWTDADIRASRHVLRETTTAQAPVYKADPLGLILVVETGDAHVSILDGDKLEPFHRFATRAQLHGSPKFTRNGRYAFFASRDGWVTKYDLWTLEVVAEVRAGLDTRNIAVAPAGDHVAVASYQPQTLVLLDGDLNLLKSVPVLDQKSERGSRVSAVYVVPSRQSFVVAMKDIAELWEVSYDPQAEDMAIGLVHDFQYREGTFVTGYLNPRRIELDVPLDNFFFNPDQAELFGVSPQGEVQVIQLDARQRIGELPLRGQPHLGSAVTWQRQGRTLMASTNLTLPEAAVIDLERRSLVRRIALKGPGFFLAAHENSRYLFVASMLAANSKHVLQVIDRNTLEVVRHIEVEPGTTLAHVEFTRDGRHALASLWRDDGALIVLDAQTLETLKRLPMKRPVGTYSVWRGVESLQHSGR
nr:cytochrome D1 domain-containing protein [Stutzerimonas sp. S1]